MYQHQILQNVLSICTLSIFYPCLIPSLLTSWQEMRDVGYSLVSYVCLSRMMAMASGTPGHLSGAVWGIYAILCVQTDSTPQSELGT